MHWNYRLVEMTDNRWLDEKWIEVREVYYNEDNEPVGHANANVSGNYLEDVREQLKLMGECLGKPLLTAGEFVGKFVNLDEDEGENEDE